MGEDVVIILEGETTYEFDDDGNEIAVTEQSEIFGTKKSVMQSEFLTAGQLGLQPACMVEIYSAEYNGAKTVLLDGERLTVYRTYKKGDRLELHLSERTGNHEQLGSGTSESA